MLLRLRRRGRGEHEIKGDSPAFGGTPEKFSCRMQVCYHVRFLRQEACSVCVRKEIAWRRFHTSSQSSRCVPFCCRQAPMPDLMVGMDQKDSDDGDEAQSKRDLLNVNCPIDSEMSGKSKTCSMSNAKTVRERESVSERVCVSKSVRECYRASQSVTERHRVSQSVTECHRVSQSVTGVADLCSQVKLLQSWFQESGKTAAPPSSAHVMKVHRRRLPA